MLKKCNLRILLDEDGGRYRPGEAISGTVELTPLDGIEDTTLTLTLQWQTDGFGEQASGEPQVLTLFEGDFPPGRIQRYPFSFDAPAVVWCAGQLDREKIKVLLKHGANIDAGSSWAAGSYSALQHCVDGSTHEKLSFAEFLIKQGATIDLHSAAGLSRFDIVRELVESSPERAREPGPDGATPLHLAATVEIADFLLDHGADPAALKATFVQNLAYAAERLKAENIKLVIEANNTRDIPGFFLNGTKQAFDIIEETGSDNLFLQYDIDHMQIMEGDLAPTIKANLSKIGHIQLADTPGRHEPGTGEINYPFLFAFLDEIGYQGWIGCEYNPLGDTVEGLGWFAPYRSDS